MTDCFRLCTNVVTTVFCLSLCSDCINNCQCSQGRKNKYKHIPPVDVDPPPPFAVEMLRQETTTVKELNDASTKLSAIKKAIKAGTGFFQNVDNLPQLKKEEIRLTDLVNRLGKKINQEKVNNKRINF